MSPIDAVADVVALVMSFAVLGNFLYYGVMITLYVLGSLGLYTIAKRREIKHPWMAWVPVLSYWTLGSIADQYMYVVKDKVRSVRKWMIALAIAMIVLLIVMYILLFVSYFTIMFDVGMNAGMESWNEMQILQAVFAPMVPGIVAGGLSIAVSIVVTVLQYVSYYRLFASCDPENKTLFLVLSLFFSFLLPIFTFVCRNKDFGMPPRRDAQPAYIPQPPYQQPVPPTQPWAPPVEPAQPVQPTVPVPPAENEQ